MKAFHKGASLPSTKRRGAGVGLAGALRCANCHAPITDEAARLEIGGAHAHRCTNPAGYTYELGCFGEAPGCRVVGEPTAEATWFAGFRWRYAHCARCGDHLGWCYEGDGRFFGLILDRLVGASGA